MIRITYHVESGIIISVEILYCVVYGPGDDGGGDPEENDCTGDQIKIAKEYEKEGMSGWSCEMFDVSVTAGQGTHNHLYGYLTTTYQTKSPLLIAALEEQLPNIGMIVVSSDWRCPVGNEAVNGRSQSQHMQGTAGDFAFSGTITESDYEKLDQIARRDYQADWVSSHGSYTRHVHVDWRNH